MKSIFLSVIVLIFFNSCIRTSPDQQTSNIKKITFASEDYFASGPFVAIEIDSTLNFKYYGGLNSNPSGFYTGTISQSIWDSISLSLNNIRYQFLDSCYPIMVDDRMIEMIVHTNKFIKHINACKSRLPSEVISTFDSILNIYKKIVLFKTTDSLIFESHVQEYHPVKVDTSIRFSKPKN